MLEINKVYCGDCLDLMPLIDDKSIDMILCDLPYGITACKWDKIIPLDKLWEQYKRIIKDNGAIVLTAREPFTSKIIISNIRNYRHKWVWNKKQSGSFFNAKIMPLQIDEDVIVFGLNKVNYYPIIRKGKFRKKGGSKKIIETANIYNLYFNYSDNYYPVNIIEIANCINKKSNKHPTQKPVELFSYLIKTYTNENELVLDNCIGSGTTAIACLKTNRNFIGIEIEPKYIEIANKRIEEFKQQLSLI
jgi:site-specific DNA-methyltransferase (adenine-specific)